MDFVFEYGFDVVPGKTVEFQQWLTGNEKDLAGTAPAGWEYVGTYAVVMTSEKEAGAFRQLWRIDSYGAMDTWAATMQEGGRFAALNDEMGKQFIDPDRSARWSQTILKSVSHTSFWGEA